MTLCSWLGIIMQRKETHPCENAEFPDPEALQSLIDYIRSLHRIDLGKKMCVDPSRFFLFSFPPVLLSSFLWIHVRFLSCHDDDGPFSLEARGCAWIFSSFCLRPLLGSTCSFFCRDASLLVLTPFLFWAGPMPLFSLLLADLLCLLGFSWLSFSPCPSPV